MVALHAFFALLGGFATMAALVAVITALLQKLTPGWVSEKGTPKPGYIFVNLGYSFLAAAAGGYVTAWIAADNPLVHVLALAITVLLPRRAQRHAATRRAAHVVHARAGCVYAYRRICRRHGSAPRFGIL